jgi:hypothetical protein
MQKLWTTTLRTIVSFSWKVSRAGFITFCLSICLTGTCWAQKLTLDLGFYTIKAVGPTSGSGTGTINLSTPGAYALSAGYAIHPQIELSPGYTIFYSKIYMGDMGFGPDFYLHYYPLTTSSGLRASQNEVSYFEREQIRPFVSVSFHQRQFQSVQSSYSGFGFDFGSEIQISKIYSIRALMRTMSLAGPSGASMNYTDLMLGCQMHF